jgi:peptidoglycan/xylan/chitin deacetylase (PgdA/CDA1 family)
MFRRLLTISLVFCLMLGTSQAANEPYITQYTHGDREMKRIAVTIDDWYEPELLAAFLDAADAVGCKLTLYPIGVNLRTAQRAQWQRAIDEGHEIGNHSNTHKNLEEASRATVMAQFDNMEKRLEAALGHPHTMNTVRYPFGAGRHNGTRGAFAKAVLDAGYSHVALWDIDDNNPKDIMRQVENGSIILLHANNQDLRTLKAILPQLQAEGYAMVTVSDLLGITPAV